MAPMTPKSQSSGLYVEWKIKSGNNLDTQKTKREQAEIYEKYLKSAQISKKVSRLRGGINMSKQTGLIQQANH